MRTLAGVVLAGFLAAAGGRPKAGDGFREIQESAGGAALEAVLPAVAGKVMVGEDAERIAAWRKEFGATLAAAKPVDVREEGDDAVVALKPADREELREVPLRFDGTRWTVAAPLAYVVGGPALAAACGRTPAEVILSARTDNGPYGPSAISFAHATQDPEQCKNRMDLWYCHSGDLHTVADGRIARVAAKRLADVTGLPLAVSWKEKLAPETGGVYVIHCRRERHRDFYVKARARAVDPKRVELEWALLAAGFGSPADIHSPQAIVSNDGADGCSGLCGRGAKRSEPEPAPRQR